MEENNVIAENGEKKRGSKIWIAIVAVVIVAIIACVAILPNLLKSNSKKFFEQLFANQYVGELIEKRVEAFPENGEKKLNVSIKNNFLASIEPSFSMIKDDLVLDVNSVKTRDNLDIKAKLNMGLIQLQKLDLVVEDDVLALSVPNLFDGFVAINDKNPERVVEKLGFKFDFDVENKEYKIDPKKLSTLNKYLKIIKGSIDEKIAIEKDAVTIEGKEFKADRYTLLLGQKDLKEISVKILEKLKDDDEALNLLVEFVNENNNLSNTDEYTVEDLKSNVKKLYEEIVNNEITDNTDVLKIDLYSNKGKTIKTVINLNLDQTSYVITFETISDKNNDYILTTMDLAGEIIKLNYIGAMSGDAYNGNVTLGVEGATATLVEIKAENIKNSEAKPRKIEELNALLLNDASDEELEDFKKELESNLGIGEDYNPYEDEPYMYEEGEFKISDEAKRIQILPSSLEAYNSIKIDMNKSDVFNILGEPDDSFEMTDYIVYSWYYNDMEDIDYVSASFMDDKVVAVYNDINSSMENNIQISKELNTEINDLNEIISNVKEEMKKEDIINVLGDKYLEVYRDKDNYTVLRWYDKNENMVEVEFDDENLAYYISDVSKIL